MPSSSHLLTSFYALYGYCKTVSGDDAVRSLHHRALHFTNWILFVIALDSHDKVRDGLHRWHVKTRRPSRNAFSRRSGKYIYM
jgi:hypothetical protein